MANTAPELCNLDVENSEHKVFVPYHRLVEFLDKPRILGLIEAHAGIDFYNREEVANAILNNGVRLFAILISIGQVGAIKGFLQRDNFRGGAFDSRLPIDDRDPLLPEVFPEEVHRMRFFREQWRFIPPEISADQSCRTLPVRTILPFLSRKLQSGDGAFGNVFKVKLYKHDSPTELICKQIVREQGGPSLGKAFVHELEILSMLRCLHHPNIIQLMTAFIIDDTYHLLMPVADEDLDRFLKSPQRRLGLDSNSEICSALWGLSSAIEAIHGYFAKDFNESRIGCHYDIRPGNILLFGPKMVLSDFGLSRLRDAEENSRTHRAGEGAYIAPECEPPDQDFEPGKAGRAGDMWSFGCVLCEILVYMNAGPGTGWDAVSQFRKNRTIKLGQGRGSWNRFYGVQEVNPEVARLLEAVAMSSLTPECQVSMSHLISDVLRIDPDQRPRAAQVTRLLFHIALRTMWQQIDIGPERNCQDDDFEFDVQCTRVRIWAQEMGLTSPFHEQGQAPLLGKTYQHADYDTISNLFVTLLHELQSIKDYRDNSAKPTYDIYRPLRTVVDQLWDMQQEHRRCMMETSLEDIMLHSNNTRAAGNRTRHPQTQEDTQIAPSGESPLGTKRYQKIQILRMAKQLNSSMSEASYIEFPLGRLEPTSFVRPFVPLHWHFLTALKQTGRRVLIEFTIYDTSWNSRTDELLRRIETIASLRRDSEILQYFPLLQCLGYYHDISLHGFGIVYGLPLATQDRDPISLRDLIDRTGSRRLHPSLTQKLNLATTLVSLVLDFHKCNWLHRNLCSFNIICCPKDSERLVESLSSPYFIGFNHSRLNDHSAFSVGPDEEEKVKDYQHPAYRRLERTASTGLQRFCQEFDYYSVGLILLEIAFWKPLEEIIKKEKPKEGWPENALHVLGTSYVPLVKTYMGDVYEQVVQACISMYSDKSDITNPEGARHEFRSKVVERLVQCSI